MRFSAKVTFHVVIKWKHICLSPTFAKHMQPYSSVIPVVDVAKSFH